MLLLLLLGSVLARPGDLLWSFDAKGSVFSSPAVDVSTGRVFFGTSLGQVFGLTGFGNVTMTYTDPDGADCDSSVGLHPDGRQLVFGCDNGRVSSVDRSSGKLLWFFLTGTPVKPVLVFSSPTFDQAGNVYVGSGDQSVYKLSSTGALLWKYATGGAVLSSPRLLPGEKVVVVGSNDGVLYALNVDDGSVRWKFATNGAIYGLGIRVSGASIFFNSRDGTLRRLTLDGQQLWKFSTNVTGRHSNDARPAVDESNGCVLFGTSAGALLSVSVSSGQLLWQFPTGGPIGSSVTISPAGDYCFGSDDEHFYCVGSKSHTALWAFATNGGVFSSPEVNGNRIYFGSIGGIFYCLSLE